MFLNAQNQQLAIKCNQKVTSFKYNLADSKVETLGSKYPFIIRNGYMNYREFALSGTITTFNDENQIFVSEAELYNNEADKYEHFNADNNID
jgi:tRNA U54 and U55 pseudouridine synthase Pus10